MPRHPVPPEDTRRATATETQDCGDDEITSDNLLPRRIALWRSAISLTKAAIKYELENTRAKRHLDDWLARRRQELCGERRPSTDNVRPRRRRHTCEYHLHLAQGHAEASGDHSRTALALRETLVDDGAHDLLPAQRRVVSLDPPADHADAHCGPRRRSRPRAGSRTRAAATTRRPRWRHALSSSCKLPDRCVASALAYVSAVRLHTTITHHQRDTCITTTGVDVVSITAHTQRV